MPPEEDRATAMGNTHEKLVKIGCVVLKIWLRTDKHADRQTDRQTDTLITILRSPIVGGVNIKAKQLEESRHKLQCHSNVATSTLCALHCGIQRDVLSPFISVLCHSDLTLPRGVLSTSWCCPSRPCVAFLACVHLALFLALSRIFTTTPLSPHGVTVVCSLPCFDLHGVAYARIEDG